MILIVTNKTDYTADFLILGLKQREIDFVRFNTEDFPQNIDLVLDIDGEGIGGQLKIFDRDINLDQIQSVWFRRPFPSEPAPQIKDIAEREFVIAESRETLDGLWRILSCFWVSHPDKLRLAESKLYQLKLASCLGFNIPQTLVTNSSDAANSFYKNCSGQVIYKPQRRGQIVRNESTGLIYTNVVDESYANYLSNVQFAPSLFQPYVPKMIELRVTVVGEKVFSVELHSQDIVEARHDWRRVDASQIRHLPHRLPIDVEEKCVKLVQNLGLAFGAIDLILTPEDSYVFLEINPNGQWAWIEQLCPELQICDALIDLLVSQGT
jgi:glutathione synthase/RimK-type ligase-like ATP-grasp enzyme